MGVGNVKSQEFFKPVIFEQEEQEPTSNSLNCWITIFPEIETVAQVPHNKSVGFGFLDHV